MIKSKKSLLALLLAIISYFGLRYLGVAFELSAVLAMAILMLTLWISESLPIAISALIPLLFLPVVGIFSFKEVSASYSHPIIFLFLGGMLMALAIERHQLHRRLALYILIKSGSHLGKMLAGFMLATALLSMWISNTATAAMMLPLAMSVQRTVGQQVTTEQLKKISPVFFLAIAYAANIGGTATLIGTPPNLVFAGLLSELRGVEISFATYLLYGIPMASIMLIICYALLHYRFIRGIEIAHFKLDPLKKELDGMGKVASAEKRVIALIGITVLAWSFRVPLQSAGYLEFLSDSWIAMGGGMLMFAIPADANRALLEWKDTRNLAWGILILFGGGLALAGAFEKVGALTMISQSVEASVSNVYLLAALLIIIMLFATELMSNVALTAVLVPVVIKLSELYGVEVVSITLPVVLAASYAFMLPISTPPNAIVFSSGMLKMSQMIKSGWVLNLCAIILLWLLAVILL
ncbi:MAG: DASS family sodium-coupled anion symporter [Cyclobacteriaceae bacterium]|nr:DASS family sodium-coupled anion symporter [Cyclobacteriaceae bacterium]MCH8515628.1 DASS family sodium-coupled anion symporter [Cyclobacteriaceae bacterium]